MSREMTNSEAISNLNHTYGIVSSDIQRSLDVAIKALEESVNELSATIEDHEERISSLEKRLNALEQDVNKELTTLATALLGAGTVLTLGAVYFIFGNRFFPVDTRRSYQHVYIKDGVSKVRHTKSEHKK